MITESTTKAGVFKKAPAFFAASLLGAIIVGIVGKLSDQVSPPLGWVFSVSGIFVGSAILAGRIAPGAKVAVVAGVLCGPLMAAAYYATGSITDGSGSSRFLLIWSVIGVPTLAALFFFGYSAKVAQLSAGVDSSTGNVGYAALLVGIGVGWMLAESAGIIVGFSSSDRYLAVVVDIVAALFVSLACRKVIAYWQRFALGLTIGLAGFVGFVVLLRTVILPS